MAALCSAAIGLGSSLVLSSGDALFLHRVGAQHLGTAFAISSALLVLVLALVGGKADRGARDRLLLWISGISALGLIGASLAVAVAPRIAASIVLVGGKQMAAALELAFWVLLAERFDSRQLRRALPRMIAAHGAGMAIGAGTVALLASVIGVPALVLAGAAAFFGAGLCATAVARGGALRPLPTPQRSNQTMLGLAEGAAAVRASPVASRLVLLVVLGGAVTPIIHYVLGVRASAVFTNESDLATFFGGYRAAVQVATVAAQALIASRLISRIGIGPAIAAMPFVALVSTIALVLRPELAAIVIAQAAIKLVDGAIETPAHKLAQNLTAREARGRVSGFLDGVAKRLGAVAGGILAATLALGTVTIAGAAIAAAWVLAALLFGSRFAELAVKELSAGPREADVAEDAALDRAGRAALVAALIESDASSRRARSLLAQLDGSGVDYSAELASALTRASIDSVRDELAVELSARLDRGLGGVLSSETIAGLATSKEQVLVLIAARYGGEVQVSSPDIEIARSLADKRAAGELSLGDFGEAELDDRELCRALAEGSLGDDEAIAARRVQRIAKRPSETIFTSSLTSSLTLSALFALRTLALRRGESASEPSEAAEWMIMRGPLCELGAAMSGPAHRVLIRAAAIELWAAAGRESVAIDIADYLGARDAELSRAAKLAMRRLGSAAIEALLRVAVFGRRRARAPALALLRDLRVPADVLDVMIDREASVVVDSTSRLPALASLAHGTLLRRRVEERITESAHTLFLLLEARHQRPAIGLAASKLRHASHRALRARAIEALDAALPRRFAPILPTLEAAPPGDRAEAASDFSKKSIPSADDAMRQELASGDRLARRLAIYALGRGGRSQFAGDITRAAEGALKSAAPQELAARLVSLISSGDNDEHEMSRSIESVLVLSELPLFSDLSTRELADLAEVVTWVSASPGDVLISEGEVGDAMFFVLEGEVVVERRADSGKCTVAHLGPGEPFGEMALFEDEVRSATVVAARDARIGRIERPAFEEIAREVPGIALGICRALSRRVRSA